MNWLIWFKLEWFEILSEILNLESNSGLCPMSGIINYFSFLMKLETFTRSFFELVILRLSSRSLKKVK
jgi:hypothetical protein